MFTEPPIVEDTPRTYRSDISTSRILTQRAQEQQQDKALLTAQETLDSITKAFNFFRKAIVSTTVKSVYKHNTLDNTKGQVLVGMGSLFPV